MQRDGAAGERFRPSLRPAAAYVALDVRYDYHKVQYARLIGDRVSRKEESVSRKQERVSRKEESVSKK